MKRLSKIFLLLVFLQMAPDLHPENSGTRHTFAIGDTELKLDGQSFLIRCGEMHFGRIPREYWQHRLKMAKAMGLNTVCAYLFWNYHEWEEGAFDWTGSADAAEFCRLAQQEGLWVIVRPGPYACAEWEMGGLPWWLLKREKISLRTKDPAFLEPATRYLREVARVLGPLQITKGGPILMFQVENEYGSFGKDAEYMGLLRQSLIDGGIDVPLFACNPPGAIGSGYREDLFQVVNFGRGPEKAFETLRKFQKTGPLMNGEFYPAWFDMWGRKHRTGDIGSFLHDLEFMLKGGMSFSIYMAHGGTSFGLWSGADRPFSPDTSSYDYDAPISEAGWVTEKFRRTRELFSQYLLPGETVPEPPAANPVIELPPFTLKESAAVLDNLPVPKEDETPRTMEFYEQGRGCMVYRTTLPAGPAGLLKVKEIHDFAWIFLEGKQVGVMDRRGKRYQIKLPVRTSPAQLDIFIEAMGRVNFGGEVFDRKGLHQPVQYIPNDGTAVELKKWSVFSLPLDAPELAALKYGAAGASVGPAFWRASVEVKEPGDTFLDMRTWGKGVVWINGHCLGRFWNIGPTQTMYCPGPWLKTGLNEVVVLDVLGPREPTLAGLKLPILDDVHLELDFARKTRASGKFDVAGQEPVLEGSFTADIQWQEARFSSPRKGRYLCLEALNATDGKPVCAIAELDATDSAGQVLSKANWKIFWVSSEEISGAPGDAENVLDGQPASFWQSELSPGAPGYPHRLVLDLGESLTMGGIRYLPRGGSPGDPGRIKDYRVYLSDLPFGLTPAP